MDWPLWRQLSGAQFFGRGVRTLIDGRPAAPPLGTDWGLKLTPTGNKAAAVPIELRLDRHVAMRDVAAVQVFDSPDFVHEPELDATARDSLHSCTRVVPVRTNGYQPRSSAVTSALAAASLPQTQASCAPGSSCGSTIRRSRAGWPRPPAPCRPDWRRRRCS